MGVEWSHESYGTVSGIVRMRKLPIIGRNPSMVIPLLANQDLTPVLPKGHFVVF